MQIKKIVFTGGGSAGHVTPNIAIIKKLKKENWEIAYIGSHNGIEKDLISKINIPYYGVSSGKLRRYFSWQNFIDPFKLILGIIQSYKLLNKLKPEIVFSKGGFVAFPIVVAAKLKKIPVIVHESDITPGLANKLSFPFAKKICLTNEDSQKYIKYKNKMIVTGTPIREEFFNINKEQAKQYLKFNEDKPILLVFGGGLGSQHINEVVRNILDELLPKFNIIHVCGKGKIDNNISKDGYLQVEYLHHELFALFALSEIIISRAGANSVYEIIANKKLNILIPLSRQASRGDQILNANYFKEKKMSIVIDDEKLTPDVLIDAIHYIQQNKARLVQALNEYNYHNGTENVYNVLLNVLNEETHETKH